MRKTFPGRRWLAALLTLTLCLTLAPAAFADDESEGDDSNDPVTPPPVAETITLVSNKGPYSIEPNSPNSVTGRVELTVAVTPDDAAVHWVVDGEDPDYSAIVQLTPNSTGKSCTITGRTPGEVKVYAYVGDSDVNGKRTESVTVAVSGIEVSTETITVKENETKDVWAATCYGSARGPATYVVNDNYVATITGGTQVKGFQVGSTVILVTDQTGRYKMSIPLEVVADPSTTIEYPTTLKSGEALPFSNLHSYFENQLDGKVVSVSGMNVSTSQGTLYYRYDSEAQPGAGVGNETYYRGSYVTGGRMDLEDITFVAKPDYLGGQVTIKYIATTEDGDTVNCSILLTVAGETSSSAGVSMTTTYNTPVQFDANEFDRVCKERTGASLSYVTFALPPVRQGTLYTNYSSAGNYGSPVSITAQYSLRSLGDIWFVPAPGYTGPVTIYYTGHSTGSPGKTYTGQVTITVSQDSGASIGGLSYELSKGSVIRFDDADFNDYCHSVLDAYQTLNFLYFTALPDASQGVLYYDYSSAANPGVPVTTGTAYYYGTRTPRLDRITFAGAADFTGTVRVPFTAQTIDGTTFSGSVDINVRGGTGTGDIQYTCRPGSSVSFDDAHFTQLSRTLTGSALNYIQFQTLPNSSAGTLYYGNTAVRTNTRYYNGSTTPRIDNLTFRAASGFSMVDIPFVGYSTNGGSFSGVVTITSSGSAGDSSNIRYTTDSKTAAIFDRDDFDGLSVWETDENVSAVRFEIPSTSQGSLYQNYRSSSSQGTRIASSSTSISASGLDRVAFVPASGYTGTVYINFTATAANGGGTFTGTVEIDVGRPAADVTARYSTRTAPVDFNAADLRRSGYTLSSIQFTSLPSASEGYVYYQYISPTRYGRQASIGTVYRTSGSNLISELCFVPRAGYTGTVSIPYTGTNSNNSTFEGEILITVSPSYGSSYFSDMSGYSAAQIAAVDFLYDHNITYGLTANQYGPESSIRRGDFALMLYQAFELSPTGTAGVFRDVPSTAYYAQAVNTLYSRGIVSGVGNGLYAPDSTLTRQDAICMVQRAMRAVGWSANDGYSSMLAGYSDSGLVASYAQGAMSFAVQRGYLPTSGGLLAPTQPLTRVAMAEIIHRVLTY